MALRSSRNSSSLMSKRILAGRCAHRVILVAQKCRRWAHSRAPRVRMNSPARCRRPRRGIVRNRGRPPSFFRRRAAASEARSTENIEPVAVIRQVLAGWATDLDLGVDVWPGHHNIVGIGGVDGQTPDKEVELKAADIRCELVSPNPPPRRSRRRWFRRTGARVRARPLRLLPGSKDNPRVVLDDADRMFRRLVFERVLGVHGKATPGSRPRTRQPKNKRETDTRDLHVLADSPELARVVSLG